MLRRVVQLKGLVQGSSFENVTIRREFERDDGVRVTRSAVFQHGPAFDMDAKKRGTDSTVLRCSVEEDQKDGQQGNGYQLALAAELVPWEALVLQEYVDCSAQDAFRRPFYGNPST